MATERLILRGWKPADIDPYAAMNADPEMMRHEGGTFGQAATFRLVAELIGLWPLRGCGMWALELRETGEFIGRAGLYEGWDWPGIEAAWTVRRDQWGRGLATEAAAAAIEWGWENLAADHLVSVITPENVASRRVAEKLGFRMTGRGDVGPWKDQALYRLDRPTAG
ncbi:MULTISPECIES: GNAT family N-acetyltransferase [unclassified Frankia]|uniref:GNAT family N-acetyltransferase n=1 Tax=unclassified Frankia TaxID=2632575 RepID=UPI001EE4E7F8|nr:MULTISPECIES: GNAT family N-acetyltransferase [unclassified Frankia]